MKNLAQVVVILAFSSVAAAAGDIKPILNVGDSFTYTKSKGGSFTQVYTGVESGQHKFTVAGRYFLLDSKTMSTTRTMSGKIVVPHNGQLILDPKKQAGEGQIGHVWKHTYKVNSGKPKTRECKVRGFGEYSLKAGKFKAYDVYCKIGKNTHLSYLYEVTTLRAFRHSKGKKNSTMKPVWEISKYQKF